MVGHFRFLLSRKGNHLKALGKRWCNLCFIKIMLMAVKELVRGEKSIQEVIVQSRIPISGSRKGKEQTDMKAI